MTQTTPSTPASASGFNALFKELFTLVKTETEEREIRNAIKAAYRVWNAATPEHAAAFHASFSPVFGQILEKGVSEAGGREILAGLTADRVLATVGNAGRRARAEALYRALLSLSMAGDIGLGAAVQAALTAPDAADLDDVLLDEELLAFIKDAAARLEETGGCGGLAAFAADSATAPLGENGIMTIARDISAGIDPDVLSRPDGMQSLVQSVSASIGERIGTGEIDPAALMREASTMMQNVDMAEIFKMMGTMGINPAEMASLAAGAAGPAAFGLGEKK